MSSHIPYFPGRDSILMPSNSYRVTVTQINHDIVAVAGSSNPAEVADIVVFSQTFPEDDFDLQAIVLAINKRKRVRKARGKEAV